MTNFWRIGNDYINLAHIVRIEYTPAYAGGEEDSELPEGQLTKPRPARCVITLSSVHAKELCDYADHVAGVASENDTIVIRGPQVERLAAWLDDSADFPADEPTTEPQPLPPNRRAAWRDG